MVIGPLIRPAARMGEQGYVGVAAGIAALLAAREAPALSPLNSPHARPRTTPFTPAGDGARADRAGGGRLAFRERCVEHDRGGAGESGIGAGTAFGGGVGARNA